MNTLKLVKVTRNLTTDMKEEQLESGITGRNVSPDVLSGFQVQLDRLVSSVKNPTLACLEDLLEVSETLDLNTASLRDVVIEGRSCLEY
tara:strand:- start:7954 stop:8220 length:267 start_codon:yes stop_codon:yes gene_type:complete